MARGLGSRGRTTQPKKTCVKQRRPREVLSGISQGQEASRTGHFRGLPLGVDESWVSPPTTHVFTCPPFLPVSGCPPDPPLPAAVHPYTHTCPVSHESYVLSPRSTHTTNPLLRP